MTPIPTELSPDVKHLQLSSDTTSLDTGQFSLGISFEVGTIVAMVSCNTIVSALTSPLKASAECSSFGIGIVSRHSVRPQGVLICHAEVMEGFRHNE
jgi:hypothetical protein